MSNNVNRKYELLETQASSNILPPQIDSNSLDPTLLPASEDFPQFDKTNDRRAALSAESEEVKTKGFLPPPTGFEPPKLLPTYNEKFRQNEEQRLKNLGVPTQPTRSKSSQSLQNVAQGTRKPARTFDADRNFAAFDHFFPSGKATHQDYDFSKYLVRNNNPATTRKSTTRRPIQKNNQFPSGPLPTHRPSPFVSNKAAPVTKTSVRTTTTTRKPFIAATKPTILARANVAVTTKSPVTAKQSFATTKQPQQVTRTFFQNQITQPTRATHNNNNQQQSHKQPVVNQKSLSAPSADLQPPFEIVKVYDDATTKGPPIYYEWKAPDDGLVPPKFDNETDTNALKRSILEEGNFEGNSDFQSSESRRTGAANTVKIQYKDLQRYFAIPQIEFPLESNGRDGYEKDDAQNSYQVKIPWRKEKNDRYYYLEHAHCNPECHPYFFKPGRCEPCIKM